MTVEAPAPATISGRTTEDVLREIVAEGDADPRIILLVKRFDVRATKRAAKEEATPDN